jgi:hypothetical protein
MIIKIVKYILIIGGCCVTVFGFVKDIDLLTFAGLLFVVAPLMLEGAITKLINRKKN